MLHTLSVQMCWVFFLVSPNLFSVSIAMVKLPKECKMYFRISNVPHPCSDLKHDTYLNCEKMEGAG